MLRTSFILCISFLSFNEYPMGSTAIVLIGSFVLFLLPGRCQAYGGRTRDVDSWSRRWPVPFSNFR
jgi:hypothetical protein